MENASLSSIQDERHINLSFAPSIKDYALGESIEVENEGSTELPQRFHRFFPSET